MASPALASSKATVVPKPLIAFEIPISFLRYSRSMPWNYELQQRKHKEMLYRALNLGTTVAFLGSGCSRNFKLPHWEGFAKEAILHTWKTLCKVSFENIHKDHCKHYQNKVIEFGRQSAIHQMDRGDQDALADGAGVTKADLDFLVAEIEKQVKNDLPQQRPSGDQLRFVLGACRQICDWCDSKYKTRTEDSFVEFVKTRFTKKLTKGDLEKGVHRKLLALPLHRFITSNYDLILEQFLAHKLGRPWQDGRFEEFLTEKAFTQEDCDSEKLARFAAGMSEDSRDMVFHCHGWCQNADSMIITEENYQRWYLGHADGAGPAFRQTMELLVGSHPILFVGFGMNDPDLLMALRTLSATEPDRKSQRSLFALLSKHEAEGGNAMEHYLDQYGVHVIGYDVAEGQDLGGALSDFLENLDQEWKNGRNSWLLKPKIHGVEITLRPNRPNEYWHYELASIPSTNSTEMENIALRKLAMSELQDNIERTAPLLIITPKPDKEDLDTLVRTLKETNKDTKRGRLIVLVGDGGTGKSWFATHLLRKLLRPQTSGTTDSVTHKGFFWSSYYADDALTGIIRANEFFQQKQKEQSRLERFTRCLQDPQNVLVFDGMERFLHYHGQPGIGFAANGDVSNFLETLGRLYREGDKYKATVVLTTRLVPELLAHMPVSQEQERLGVVELFSVMPMTAEEAKKYQTSGPGRFSDNEWSRLVTLLSGHRYGMDLASLWPHGQIDNLIHYLGNVGPPRRVERMIELTMCRLEQTVTSQNERLEYDQCDGQRPYQLLMKRLAVFLGPIKENTTFKYCHELARQEWEKNKGASENSGGFPKPDVMWKMLTQNKLLLLVEWSGEGPACVMHAVVREFIFHNFHKADARRLASFTQTGFTSGANMVDPGKKGAEIIEELFCELRRQCREAYKWQPGAAVREAEVKRAQGLCQEAFGVLRSRMLANTVGRWGSYPKYIHYLVRMGDLARAYCGMRQQVLGPEIDTPGNVEAKSRLFWKHCDPALCENSDDLVIHPHGPLFGDELAWLYHELGLALYHEGAMIDCLGIWEQGLEVNKFLDGNQPGQYTFQAYCNLGAASIQSLLQYKMSLEDRADSNAR